MKDGRILTFLTLVNLGILGFLLFHETRIVEAKGALPVLRGSGLEIVDAQGKVRASIQLVPGRPRNNGRRFSCEGPGRSIRKQCSFG